MGGVLRFQNIQTAFTEVAKQRPKGASGGLLRRSEGGPGGSTEPLEVIRGGLGAILEGILRQDDV